MDSRSQPGSVAAFKDCPNCEVELHGPYCALCGQRNNHERLDTKELVLQVVDELVGFDTALFRTVKGLTLAPGRLMSDYVEGHRRDHVGPFRYAVFSVLIVMSLLSLAPAALTTDVGAVLPEGLVPGFTDVAQALVDEVTALALRYGRPLQLILLPLNAMAYAIAFGALSWFSGLRLLQGRMKRPRKRNQAELFCMTTYAFAHTNLMFSLPLVLVSFVLPQGELLISLLSAVSGLLILSYSVWAATTFFEIGVAQSLVGNVVAAVLLVLGQLGILAVVVAGVMFFGDMT